jgi:tRNA-splicing ligase RtcB (3'-phosphate/5'-hydroxy nucleic acid ligase)
MKTYKLENGMPVKMWLENIEDGALEQLNNLSMLPFAFSHIAVMPDCHQGYGMPIGGVLATKGVVIPNAVGVDIGCGMCAVKTSLNSIDTETLKEIMGLIRKSIPLGFNHQEEKQDEALMPKLGNQLICGRQYESALKQIGTLGGGNHFIEIQKGSDGYIWVMIHSGSRNLGKQVADHYNKVAEDINEKYYSIVPKAYELAFLPSDTKECSEYMDEMNYCVDFALANRKLMMSRIMSAFNQSSGAEQLEFINIAHNYARYENHFGENVIVHRKGATSARYGEIGIIPGSQGTSSYIVRGKGNKDSFESCSHGAGRKMGRKQAERTLVFEDEQKLLNDRGIVHSIRYKSDLDEATGAYKSIDEVMSNQKDLVDIVVKLEPLGGIKG